MNRKERREQHTFTGAQLNKLIEHNVNEGFQEGKAVTIGKMTEIYSVAAAYALFKDEDTDEVTARELVDRILDTFTEFNKGSIDYEEAKAFVESKGIKFAMMPESVQQQVAQEQS